MDEFWYRLIESLLLAFLPVLASLAAGALFAWMRKQWAEFKAAQPDVAFWMESAARMAVEAAEQAGAVGYIENKKTYALEIAQKYLDTRGIKIDLDLLDAAIEAAVRENINRDREYPKPDAVQPGE